jgi:hypothetical protein
MTTKKDDWEKPRGNGTRLTKDEIGRLRILFNCGLNYLEAARDLKCSSRVASKYYAIWRGKPHEVGKPKYRHRTKPVPAAPAPMQSRFYKSNFEL